MKRAVLVLALLWLCPSVSAIDLTITQEYEDNLIRRLEALRNRDENSPPIKCLTSLALEISFVKDKVSPKTRELLKQYSPGRYTYSTPESTYDSPAGHFRLHYTKYGPDSVYKASQDINPANGVPDYVDTCARIFDYVWAKEVDTMGYNRPPSDGTAGGGDDLYDVYIYKLSSVWGGALSVTESESETSPWWSYTSIIHLNNNYLGFGYPEAKQYDLMGVTAGHEFFHAIQFGYDIFEGYEPYPNWRAYWMEMSSTWMEDQTFDEVNDYIGYLSSFFDFPCWSLKTFSTDFVHYPNQAYHPYASCVFPIYLSEKFGVDIMRRIWEECGRVPESNVWPAVDSITGDLGETFREFTVWNFFTADRADTANYYSEGNLWYSYGSPIQINTWWCPYLYHDSYPVEVDSVYGPCQAQGLAADYIFFSPYADSAGGLRIEFDGSSNDSWRGSVIGYSHDSVVVETLLMSPEKQDGVAYVVNWDRFDYVVFVPARFADDTLGSNFKYLASYDSELTSQPAVPDAIKILQSSPNPFVIGEENGFVSFPMLIDEATYVELYILTLAGELVKEVYRGNLPAGDYSRRDAYPGLIPALAWDGKNQKGEKVASGVYLYQIKTKNAEILGKMAVVRK